MSLKYEPASEPLHIYVKLLINAQVKKGGGEGYDAEMVIQKALCQQKCNQPLGCGHVCPRLCHGAGIDVHSEPCRQVPFALDR